MQVHQYIRYRWFWGIDIDKPIIPQIKEANEDIVRLLNHIRTITHRDAYLQSEAYTLFQDEMKRIQPYIEAEMPYIEN